ncbi:MAG TPA: hypothetical protein ENN19_00175 [Chloroflexi bacterium]|nr:hypothetical protein [Chloroflexota bacterium]
MANEKDNVHSSMAYVSERDLVEALTPEAQAIDVPDVISAFEEGGLIAQALGRRYRYRAGQVDMANLVRQALIEERPALLEAGTGCGKSFAYLMPVIASGARAFVSTANKTLQTQLWEKDIPTLRRFVSRSFSAALLKGRSNYVCRFKLRDAHQQIGLPGLEDDLDDLVRSLRDIPSGDVEDLRLPRRLRDMVTAGQHECVGRDCPHFGRCYYELAKVAAEEADLVVVNHALLAFNLVLPFLSPRPVLVVDEAHALEGYVVNALRLVVGYETIPQFVNDQIVIRHVPDGLRGETVRLNRQLFEILSDKPSTYARRWAVQGELQEGLALSDRINKIHKALLNAYSPAIDGDEEEGGDLVRHQAVIDWAAQLTDQVRALAESTPDHYVRYCEEREPGPAGITLCCEPLQVADFLRQTLFEPVKRVICTGATLTTARHFAYFCQLTGAPREQAIKRVIESPFDYARQALLYTPNGLEPRYGEGEEAYVLELGREIWRLLQASRGRAFVLCTSTRRMNELYDLISPHLEYNAYCQGSGISRAELLELFQHDDDGAVLFATRSFWEGVDVPGAALSLVIIDKLPFAPHHDPVIQYRQQLLRDEGGNPFMEMTLPEAILALKQGVGRLIRTESDRGVIAILDSRVNTKRYGQQVIASLPPARRTRRIADVRRFFAQEVSESA